MSTHRSTWKKREQSAAHLFGARRQPGSGSQGQPDRSTSDSNHEILYIETKTYARHAARSLWRDAVLAARKEGKRVVLALYEKGKPGALLCIHEADMDTVCAEWLLAKEARAIVAAMDKQREDTAAQDAAMDAIAKARGA